MADSEFDEFLENVGDKPPPTFQEQVVASMTKYGPDKVADILEVSRTLALRYANGRSCPAEPIQRIMCKLLRKYEEK
jgi:hypothetical protein